MTDPSDLPAALAAFEMTLLDDLQAGRRLPVEEYVRRFPGFEAEIRGAHDRIRGRARDRTDGLPATAAGLPVLERGTTLGPYQLLRELGRGGQGAVWLAEDSRLARKVAIKVLEHAAPHATELVRRFQREAEVSSRLDHPHLCTILDTGRWQGLPFLVLRFIDGETLARRIAAASQREGPLAPGDTTAATATRTDHVLLLVERIARALHVAHEAGVVHRDVKPGNVMVTPGGEPVVLDFGIAYDDREEGATLTRTGDLLGTPAYLSPEQIEGTRGVVDRRTDVWALGVVLFECLALARPFQAPTRDGIVQAILHAPLPDIRRLCPGLHGDVAVILATALERDLRRRYRTALDLAEDLRRVRQREPILARPAGPLRRLRRWAERNPMLATLTTTLVVGLSGGLLWSAHQNRELQQALDEARWLADAKLIDVYRADMLHVPSSRPADLPRIERWLGDARTLAARLPQHRARLAAVRADGRCESQPGGERWRFSTTDQQWYHDTLTGLVRAIEQFTAPGTGTLDCMQRAQEHLARVEHQSLVAGADAWAAAIADLAEVAKSPAYRGLRITPQSGLLPLGKDPDSGLWEFAHLRTGDPAPRGADGKVRLTEASGLVLVLLPGGTFQMGSRKPDAQHPPGSPHVDPWAIATAPVHEVTLAPFFLSKFELTQAQYLRFEGSNPSVIKPPVVNAGNPTTLMHPVENVTWTTCRELCDVLGLLLPTEAQWEYASRGGTTTVWWTGDDLQSLRGAANLADQHMARDIRTEPNELWTPWDDGYYAHAPVGTYRPNPFGLFDMLGNVAEWCLDDFILYTYPARTGDGFRGWNSKRQTRALRGGASIHEVTLARSACRASTGLDDHASGIGVRPARGLAETTR